MRPFARYRLRKQEKSSRHRPGDPPPWDTWRDNQGSARRCPRDFLKGHFCWDTGRVFQKHPPGVPGLSRGFSENLRDFFLMCLLCSLFFRQVPGCTKSMCAPSCELWRTLMKFGELWRTHNNTFTRTSVTFTRVPAKVPRIHQSSGEGAFCIWVAFRMCPIFVRRGRGIRTVPLAC